MTDRDRPDPNALLAAIQEAESKAKRGGLTIFFGMAPGVGKTYAMLETAQRRFREGMDIVAGIVETHGRPETEALLTGLPQIPRKNISYRHIELAEFDIDAALARKPQILLVDELAHTNAPGSRHPKRYQDVLELLDAGISVYTTLNVQHIESRADVVAQISGAIVRETVPDSILDFAQLELVDLTPDQLLQRLSEGKVYLGDRAAAAIEHFFRPGNLTALREMALRFTAERVDRELRDFMRIRQIAGPWKARERLLVAVSASPFSEPLIRWTRRAAAAMNASWLAVHVEPVCGLPETEKARVTKNLSTARELGAEVVMTTGDDVVAALLHVAQQNNVTQIVLGKSFGNPLRDFLRGGSLVDKVIRRSGDIDVYVVRATMQDTAPRARPARPRRPVPAREYAITLLTVALLTIACWFLTPLVGYRAVALIYLAAILFAGLMLSRGPVALMATLSAILWNLLFIPPLFTFIIAAFEDKMMFATYFVVALVVGHLTAKLKAREQAERTREGRATALYRFVRAIAEAPSLDMAFAAAARQMNELFQADCAVLFDPEGGSDLIPYPPSLAALSERVQGVAAWVLERGQPAGRFTDTLSESAAIYIPIKRLDKTLGVLRVQIPEKASLSLGERHLLEAYADQLSAVIEREQFADVAQRAKLAEKADRLHKTLLDCVSHELKTPLAAISAAAQGLESGAERESDRGLAREIEEGTQRLKRIVDSLLDIARIETGVLSPNLEWCELRELIESAMDAERNTLGSRQVRLTVAEPSPLVRVDALLIQQALSKLLANAAQYSPAEAPIEVSAKILSGALVIAVMDSGPGLPPDAETLVFGKFYRGIGTRTGGLGLGLSIARGFVEAHGGKLTAANRPEGGAKFTIELPVETALP